LIYDYRNAELSAADRALCDYAVKLTLVPGKMSQEDTDRLRDHGFDDAQITIAAQVIGYFNYINRIADGLGVDSEDWMTLDPGTWQQEKASDYKLRI
jgi:uncharacterized peroxidase-related enzyme